MKALLWLAAIVSFLGAGCAADEHAAQPISYYGTYVGNFPEHYFNYDYWSRPYDRDYYYWW